MKKKIDVVGNKLYYLIKNTIDFQYTRIKDMETNAISLLNSNLYIADDLDELSAESNNLKDMKYKELYKKFKEIYDSEIIDLPSNNSKF